MKYIIMILIIISAGCDHTNSVSRADHSTVVCLIVDVSDKRLLYPSINPLLKLFELKQYPSSEASLSITSITDKTINPSYSCKLVSEAEGEKLNAEDDGQFRSKAIVDFYQRAGKTLNTFYKETDTASSLQFSECWSAVATQLTTLAKSPSTRKFLIVYSDLLERADKVNVYRNISSASVQEISTALMNAQTVPASLRGITCYIVYQPATRQDDKKVSKMFQVYKSLIEGRGGKVEIKTNIEND